MTSRKTRRQLFLTGVALAAAACLAPLAQADTAPASAVSTVVSYRDLDPNSAAGARALYQRIRDAAQFVCGAEGRRLDEQLAWERCVHVAMSDAVKAVHSPQLSSFDAAHGGPGLQTAQLRR